MFFSVQPLQVSYQDLTFNSMPMYFCYFSPNNGILQSDVGASINLEEKSDHATFLDIKECSKDEELPLEKKSSFQSDYKFEKNIAKKKRRNQQQYNPRSSQKKNTKTPFQNSLRNILPNIIHQIFCFIQKQKRSGDIVKKFLQSECNTQEKLFDINRFYRYQRLIKDKTNHYINMKGLIQLNKFQEPLCEIYSQAEQLKFIRMNRILLKYFLEHEFESIVLTSTRMKSQTRIWHFQLKRKILMQLGETFGQF